MGEKNQVIYPWDLPRDGMSKFNWRPTQQATAPVVIVEAPDEEKKKAMEEYHNPVKEKKYATDVTGLIEKVADYLSGNTTYVQQPAGIKQENRSDFGVKMDSQLHDNSTLLGNLYRTWMPTVMAAGAKSNPWAMARGVVGGMAGAKAMDLWTNLETGKEDWHDYSHGALGDELAHLTNPGGWIGGGAGIKTPTFLKRAFGQRALDAAYQNITPISYTSKKHLGISKPKEFLATIKDFITGKGLDNEIPKWKPRVLKAIEEATPEAREKMFGISPSGLTPKAVVEFRDEAWRLGTNPSKYKGKLYEPNENGTYRYNLKEVERIRKETGSRPLEDAVVPMKGNTPYEGISYDPITENGGYVQVSLLTPDQQVFPFLINQGFLGRPEYTIRDVWDLHPFKDSYRSLGGRFFPLRPFLKNLEVFETFGRKPFVLEQTIPEGTNYMYWYKNNGYSKNLTKR